MSYYIGLIIGGVVGCIAIYWLIDWKNQIKDD
jgi:hypothetical protein